MESRKKEEESEVGCDRRGGGERGAERESPPCV